MFHFGKRVPWQTEGESHPQKQVLLAAEGESQRAEWVPTEEERGSKVGRVESGTKTRGVASGERDSSYKEAGSHFVQIVSGGTKCDSRTEYVAVRVGERGQQTERRLGNAVVGGKRAFATRGVWTFT